MSDAPVPVRRFFLIVPPGLEPAAEGELRAWGLASAMIVARTRGGLEVEAPLETGLALLRRLKVPTRVLLRLADFGCRDFPKLFKKTRGLPWAEMLEPGARVEFEASTHGSWLRIKRRIEESANDGFKAAMKLAAAASGGVGAKDALEAEPFRAYARFNDDVCEISLDLSGERQDRRGARTRVGEAPLRENLAAGLLYALAGAGPARAPVELFDPMCGTGAFALEALALTEPVRGRAYAYERMKPAREGRWVEAALEAQPEAPRFARALGWDLSERSIEAARANAGDAGLEARAAFEERDVFVGSALPALESGERWLVVNPPYGERLAVVGEGLTEFYGKLAARLEEVAKPDRAGLLLPAKAHPSRLRWPKAWRAAGAPIALSNGGIPVFFHVFFRRG